MENSAIEKTISDQYPDADLQIEGEDCSFTVTIVCESFSGVSKVKRQQDIYALFSDVLKTGELHALSIKAFTPEEWNAKLEQTKGLVSIQM